MKNPGQEHYQTKRRTPHRQRGQFSKVIATLHIFMFLTTLFQSTLSKFHNPPLIYPKPPGGGAETMDSTELYTFYTVEENYTNILMKKFNL
jgi:hypothetical protein